MSGMKGRCKFVPEGVGANCTGYHRVKHGSEEALQRAVAKVGPISVAIYVDETFMHYKNGIYNNSICLSRYLNHGVLVVGYGSENGSDYWIVKNSWGESWGVAGYVLMSRNARNQCGIASHAVFPSV
ncbi:cathepsin K [Caerostris darwini]|uniref:Cathepsin K n=1 Tax=Caerostris darwini TaxID=1538125 RepID=A0AAV4V595_9ARAC|nr:cathepsin K [Caerostris darwini]